MASSPTYDANAFAGAISPEVWRALNADAWHPMRNRAVAGGYPPGSTYKAFVAAAGLAEKAITLVRDRDNLVPMRRGLSTLVLTYAPEADITAGRTFASAVRAALGPGTRVQRIGARTPRSELDSLGRGIQRVVFSTHGRTVEAKAACPLRRRLRSGSIPS